MRWLDRHAGSACAVGPAAAHAVWLTGQSSWAHSHLSPAQRGFLDALAGDGWTPVRAGFPWTTSSVTGEYRRAALPLASVRNAAQHLAARPGSRFAHQIAHHLQPVLDLTGERLLLLCGSTGAQLLAAAAPLVAVPPGLVVHVVALGPVGRLPRTAGAWQVRVVRGRSDGVSRLGYRGPADAVVPGGHLDAATSPAALAAVRALVPAPRPAATADGPPVGRR